MAACQLNTDYQFRDMSGNLIKEFSINRDYQNLVITNASNGLEVCSYNIVSGSFTGVQVSGNNLRFSGSFSGLLATREYSLKSNLTISVVEENGILQIIGIDDIASGFEAPRINIRFDSENSKLIVTY